MSRSFKGLATGTALATAAFFATLAPLPASADEDSSNEVRHVLLISIDGLHAVDLQNYIADHPESALAGLAEHGVVYANATGSAPSDSFPGLLALVTGGTPKSTGVFYDVSYDRKLFPPGSNCVGTLGTMTHFDEFDDKDVTRTDAGGTLRHPLTQIDATQLPLTLKAGVCVPVYPHDILRVNTLFEVIRGHGGYTAWSDKHPAYDLVNGPSGEGVIDLFTPEVNSNDAVTGVDTTKGFHSVQRNDELKVQSILNEIDGKDSTGSVARPVPKIFGMNFQAVSVGQKLAKGNSTDPADAGLIGGYADAAGLTPNNGLVSGLDYADNAVGRIVAALNAKHLDRSTLVIITAKHGQSPIDLALRQAVDDGPYGATPGLDFFQTDDVALIWLKKSAQAGSYAAAKHYLETQKGPLGIVEILARAELTSLSQDPFKDNKTPDFIAITTPGLIYTGGSKLAEHGGFAHDDRNVGLLVSHPALSASTNSDDVETRQVAPTILRSLGISPSELRAVTREGTDVLPGLF